MAISLPVQTSLPYQASPFEKAGSDGGRVRSLRGSAMAKSLVKDMAVWDGRKKVKKRGRKDRKSEY